MFAMVVRYMASQKESANLSRPAVQAIFGRAQALTRYFVDANQSFPDCSNSTDNLLIV